MNLNFPVKIKKATFSTFPEWVRAIFEPLQKAGFNVTMDERADGSIAVFFDDLQGPVEIYIPRPSNKRMRDSLVWPGGGKTLDKAMNLIAYLCIELSAIGLICSPYNNRLDIIYPDSHTKTVIRLDSSRHKQAL